MLAVLKNVPSQVIAYFICFVVSLLLGIIMIPLLKRFKFGQIQREDGLRVINPKRAPLQSED